MTRWIALTLLLLSSLSWAWVIDGDTVYINNSYAYISVTPHTATGLITQRQTINLTSKLGTAKTVNISIYYDRGSIANPHLLSWENWTHDREVITAYTFNCSYSYLDNSTNATVLVYQNCTGRNVTVVSESYFDWRDRDGIFSTMLYKGRRINTALNVRFGAYESKLIQIVYDVVPETSGKFSIIFYQGAPEGVANGSVAPILELDPWWNSSCLYSFPVSIVANESGWLFDGAHVSMNTTNGTIFNSTTCGNIYFTLGDNTTVLDYEIENVAPHTCGASATLNTTYFVFGNWSNTTQIFGYACGLGSQYAGNAAANWRAAGYLGVYHGVVRNIGGIFTIPDRAGYNNLTNLSAGACQNITGNVGEAYNATSTCRMGALAPVAIPNGTNAVSQSLFFRYESGTTFDVMSGFHDSGLYGRALFRHAAPYLKAGDGGTSLVTTYDVPANIWTYAEGSWMSAKQNASRYNTTNQLFQTANGNLTLASISTYAGMAIGAPYHSGYWATYSAYGGADEWRIYNGTMSEQRMIFQAAQSSGVGDMITLTTAYYAPVLASLNMSPLTLYNSTNLTCSANWTDAENSTLQVWLGLLVNGSAVFNTTNSSYSAGDIWTTNYSLENFTAGDNASCFSHAWDGTNISALNVTANVTIGSVPTVHNVTFISLTPANGSYLLNQSYTWSWNSTGIALNCTLQFNGTNITGSNTSAYTCERAYAANITGASVNVTGWANTSAGYFNTGAYEYEYVSGTAVAALGVGTLSITIYSLLWYLRRRRT